MCVLRELRRNYNSFNPDERSKRMRILFVNNHGGGFADYIEIPQGTMVAELFERQMQSAKPADYLIRVDRQPAARDQVLVEGNRVTMTPIKIEGARLSFMAHKVA